MFAIDDEDEGIADKEKENDPRLVQYKDNCQRVDEDGIPDKNEAGDGSLDLLDDVVYDREQNFKGNERLMEEKAASEQAKVPKELKIEEEIHQIVFEAST